MEITPEKFGRYVLLDRIGKGGMAEVFRAVMPGVEGFQRTFVVKRILAETALLPVAYYTGRDFKPAKRLPARNQTHWNAWGRRR